MIFNALSFKGTFVTTEKKIFPGQNMQSGFILPAQQIKLNY